MKGERLSTTSRLRMEREKKCPENPDVFGARMQTRHELQARGHNLRWYLMKESSASKQQSIEPTINGAATSHPRPEDRQRSWVGDADLAAAIERLVQYLEDTERAKRPEEQIQHRTMVDPAMLREWLARENPGLPGKNPGSGPVVGHQGTPGRAPQAEAQDRQSAQRPMQPVKVFRFGEVRTKVWVNHHAPGHLTWNVQQVRVYQGPKGMMEARSFKPEDLVDAMRGATLARRWIKANERRYRFLGWFLGL